MKITVDEDFMKIILKSLQSEGKNESLIEEIDEILRVIEQEKEEERHLENQEIWIKCFFNGYFYTFNDMSINVEIKEENPNFKVDGFMGTTTLFPPLIEKEGMIDLTPILLKINHKMKENPEGKFKCYATGFSRQMHFDKDLLSRPIPKEILRMFGIEKKDE